MAGAAYLQRLLLTAMTLKSVAITLNEVIVALKLVENQGFVGLDSLVAETGLPRSTVANILRFWTEVGVINHRKSRGYRFEERARYHLRKMFLEVDEISREERDYLSRETFNWLESLTSKSKRNFDQGMIKMLRQEFRSNR